MRALAWRWLALLLVPGCVLVQPLDEAKPNDEDSSTPAGSGNTGSSGGPSKAGSGNAGRAGASGAPGAAGSANGGAPSGVDFSLFTGTWKIAGGEVTSTCDDGVPKTASIDAVGTTTLGLGTTSDLIVDPGTACEIWVDVDDRSAALNSGTSPCSYTDDMEISYYIQYDSYEFSVSGDGKSANASMVAYVEASDANGNAAYCHTTTTWKYAR